MATLLEHWSKQCFHYVSDLLIPMFQHCVVMIGCYIGCYIGSRCVAVGFSDRFVEMLRLGFGISFPFFYITR